MTSATQVLSQRIAKTSRFTLLTIVRQNLGLFVLIGLLFASAVGVVYVRDLNRRLFVDLQQGQKAAENMQVEWGQLLLEQSTWAAPARVQALAQDKLAMQVPALKAVNLVSITH